MPSALKTTRGYCIIPRTKRYSGGRRLPCPHQARKPNNFTVQPSLTPAPARRIIQVC